MFCRDYQFIKTVYKEDNTVDYFLIYVELYSSSTPATLPTDAVGIDNFPEAWDPSLVKFSPGSVLYAVDDAKLYLANAEFEFKEQ